MIAKLIICNDICNPPSLRDLGRSIGFAVTSSSHIDTEPSAGVRQWHRRKALCVCTFRLEIIKIKK